MKRLTKQFMYGLGHKDCYDACSVCDVAGCCDSLEEMLEKLAHFEDLEEQGRLIELPCKVGDTVYIITTCKDFGEVLDGTLWGADGGYGTATRYCCPYDLNDSCPFEDDFEECEGGCECFENTSAIFEDYIDSIMIFENETVVFLVNCGCASFSDFGKTVFLTKEAAEAKLAEMEGAENDS